MYFDPDAKKQSSSTKEHCEGNFKQSFVPEVTPQYYYTPLQYILGSISLGIVLAAACL